VTVDESNKLAEGLKEAQAAPETVKTDPEFESFKAQFVEANSVIIKPEGKVFEKFPLLEALLSLLNTKGELNNVLAGYVAKIFGSLAERRRSELWNYFQENSIHFQNLIRHSYNVSIAEALSKMLNNYFGETNEPLFLSQRKEMIKTIVTDTHQNNLEGRYEVINTLINSGVEVAFILTEEIIKPIYESTCASPANIKPGLRLLKAIAKTHPELDKKLESIIVRETGLIFDMNN
jgi:hypothetical protein